jgi:DNA-binding NarL/FixJ family response regulator
VTRIGYGYDPEKDSGAATIHRPRMRARGDISDRECEVLVQVAYGKSNEQIAAELHISEETVKSHVRHIFQALGVKNRAHAVYTGCLRGLIPLEAG